MRDEVLASQPQDWRAVADAVPPHAWWLLVSNLFWVLAYDTEYAMVDRDDDIRIGIRTSALTLGRFDVAGVMAFYLIHLASWAAIGRLLGLGGWFLQSATPGRDQPAAVFVETVDGMPAPAASS